MSWEDQGRQEHGWFGHGTAPPKLKPDESGRSDRFGPDGLDQRIRAMGHTAITAIPRTLRHHPATRYDEDPALDQLATTVHQWVRGLLLDRAAFASRYFGRGASDPVVDHLWQAAKFAAVARNEAELRAGTGHLAAAMQAEGLDRWGRFMSNAQQRAASAARLPVPTLNDDPEPEQTASEAVRSPIRVAAGGEGGTSTASPALDVTPPGAPIAVPGITSNAGGTTVRLGTVRTPGARLSPAGQDALYRREAQNGVSNHTHWPGGASGVTIGPGYDMRDRTPQEIENDLTAVGVDPATAHTLAQGYRLRGADAQAFAQAHRNDVSLTDQQQRALFTRVYPRYEQEVRDDVHVPLNQSQFDAMVSYAYNRGQGGFRTSDVLRYLNSGQFGAVPGELNRANPPNLAGRRAAEANQFQGLPFLPPPYR